MKGKTTVTLPDNFDWKYYLKANPDVAKINRYNSEEGAKQHWINWGHKEGRVCAIPGSNASVDNLIIEGEQVDVITDAKIETIKPCSTNILLTVVIPNKLGQTPNLTIDSLYRQTFTNFNIILINDHENNANKARNEGLKKISTPYVLFSDNDIIWTPNALQVMYECLENNPNVSIAYGSFRIGEKLHRAKQWNLENLKKVNFISTMSMVRTAHHPGFDENIKRLQDWDTWLTMAEQNRIGMAVDCELFSTPIRNGITLASIPYDEAVRLVKKKHKILSSADKKIAIEIPSNDTTSGGINTMLKLVVELPKYNPTSGGVNETMKLINKFNNKVIVRFHKLTGDFPQLKNSWTVGIPDNTFPTCDACITYSDTPYLNDLINLPQVDKVLVYMLSYGMCIERERKNIKNENAVIMCSTKKLEKQIIADGGKVHRVGFAINVDEMYNKNKERKNYLAIMCHPSPDKRYSLAVSVANELYNKKIINGVITFGSRERYNSFEHPKGLVKHYPNATRSEILEIFNETKCFLMPSVSEGLNLTPLESTLCGCPSILCDGAIDELFFDKKNCFIVARDDKDEMIKKVQDIIKNFKKYSNAFALSMYEVSKTHTYENVINNIMKLI